MTKALPFTVTGFIVDPINWPTASIQGDDAQPARYFACEAEADAFEYARGCLCDLCRQVTITALSAKVDTFALCHLLWRGRDTDWRTWVGGEFVAGFAVGGK